MVSFQYAIHLSFAICCSDVVKKPKLNQHHGFCHAAFDCIDCSTTFHSPAEFQGHTSCMTEAEKYQKSVYKGPRTVGSWGAAPRGNGRDGFQGRGGYQARPTRYQATGANGTPLGTPQRMSPFTTPPLPSVVPPNPTEDQPSKISVSAPEIVEIKTKTKSKTESKTKDKKTSEDTTTVEPLHAPSTKKHKKSTDDQPDAVESAVDDTPALAEVSGEKEKKSKKKEKRKAAAAEDEALESQGAKDEESDESGSKSKKRKRDDGAVDSAKGKSDKKEKKSKKKDKVDETPTNGASTDPSPTPIETEAETKVKTKKRKRDKIPDDSMDVDVTPTNAPSVAPEEKKKKKKKHESTPAEPATDVEPSAMDVDAPPLTRDEKREKKKEKKEKKEKERSSKKSDKASA
ncbi:hypothetical protein DFH29DRAFT_927718 [Suillus ampliporus]|nr:hypothetical protein DFH29DRAFT_927718 [Suillus ampliporus]